MKQPFSGSYAVFLFHEDDLYLVLLHFASSIERPLPGILWYEDDLASPAAQQEVTTWQQEDTAHATWEP